MWNGTAHFRSNERNVKQNEERIRYLRLENGRGTESGTRNGSDIYGWNWSINFTGLKPHFDSFETMKGCDNLLVNFRKVLF